MKKIYLVLIALLAGSLPLLSQQEATLHSMRSLPQVQSTNPAFIPQQQFYIALPGAYAGVANSGFNYNSIFDLDPEGKPINIDLIRLQNRLGKKNYLTGNAQVDALGVGVKINARMFLTFSTTVKANLRFMYPDGLTGLILHGNAAYIGEEISLSPRIDHIAYLENAIGGSYIINDKLTVGTRLKILKGISHNSMQGSDFTLYTDPETYALTLTGNMNTKAAGAIFQYDFLNEDGEVFDANKLRYSSFQNNGFAIDLGATYKINNRLELGFSALNLGSINWKNAGEFYMDEVKAEFKGLDAKELFNKDSQETEEFGNDIEDQLEYGYRKVASYRSGLPTQFYLSARYELARNLHANGLFFSELYEGRFMPAFSAAVNKDFGRRLSTSVSYTAANRSYSNIGAGMAFRLTPFQLFMVSDNLISTPLFYRSAKAFNFRMGLNLVFGYRKSETKLPSAN